MFFIIHVLLGSLIGGQFNSVLFIISASLISHFLLDMIPHWDGAFNNKFFCITDRALIKKSTLVLHLIDFLCALLLIMLLYYDFHDKLLTLGALVSIFPDIMKAGYKTRLRKSRNYMRILRFHSKIQRDVNWKFGLLTQFIAIIVLLKIVF